MKPTRHPLRPAGDFDHPGLPVEPTFGALLRDALAAGPDLAEQWLQLEQNIRESLGFAEDMQRYRAALARIPASIAHNSPIARTITGPSRTALAQAIAKLVAPPVPGLRIEVLGPMIAPANLRTHQPGLSYWGVGAVQYPPGSIEPEGPAFVLVDAGRWQDHWTEVPRARHPDYSPLLCTRPVRSPGALLPWVNSLLDVALTEATIDATRADRQAALRRESPLLPADEQRRRQSEAQIAARERARQVVAECVPQSDAEGV